MAKCGYRCSMMENVWLILVMANDDWAKRGLMMRCSPIHFRIAWVIPIPGLFTKQRGSSRPVNPQCWIGCPPSATPMADLRKIQVLRIGWPVFLTAFWVYMCSGYPYELHAMVITCPSTAKLHLDGIRAILLRQLPGSDPRESFGC